MTSLIPDNATVADAIRARERRLNLAEQYVSQHPELRVAGNKSSARDPNREAFRQAIVRWIANGGPAPWESLPEGSHPYPPQPHTSNPSPM